jgi:hypothetical protein
VTNSKKDTPRNQQHINAQILTMNGPGVKYKGKVNFKQGIT